MISFIIPTRDRPALLAETLRQIGSLSSARMGAHRPEVIVIDNASSPPVQAPTQLDNGIPVRVIRAGRNLAAAARNFGAREAQGRWLFMLDDDSFPMDDRFIDAVHAAADDVAAIGGEILLPSGRHEAGGLPEVFIGCGVLIRRDVFLSLGGYDPSFGYYAEEYDLAAKMISAGLRIVHDFSYRVMHQKSTVGRNMNTILSRLVRNNGWVARRYSPTPWRDMTVMVKRYRAISRKERASCGWALGVARLVATVLAQRSATLSPEAFDRFTGLAAVRESLRGDPQLAGVREVSMTHPGKHEELVRQALGELGITISPRAEVAVVGTLSPGPLADGWIDMLRRGRHVITPWSPRSLRQVTREWSVVAAA